MLKMIFVGRNRDRNQGDEEKIIIYQQDITAGVKMQHTDKKKFVRDIILFDMNKYGRNSRKSWPRRPGEEEEQPKCQPTRFSAVIGRSEPGQPITALNREG